jgi:hypothetical protein
MPNQFIVPVSGDIGRKVANSQETKSENNLFAPSSFRGDFLSGKEIFGEEMKKERKFLARNK